MGAGNAAAVDAALVAVLAGDPTLMALLPDGVCFDVGKKGAKRFVYVTVVLHEVETSFGATAFERIVYLVKATALESSLTDVAGAAFRLIELLDRVPMTIAGYSHMETIYLERVRYTEVDAIDNDIRWQHWGGQYEITVSPDDDTRLTTRGSEHGTHTRQ